MSLRVSAGNLGQSVKKLRAEWQQTRNYWHDQKSREFEETYLEELPHALSRAALVIEEIDALLRKVRSDCE